MAHASREGSSRLLGAGYPLGRLGEAGPPSRLSLAEGAHRPWAVREAVVTPQNFGLVLLIKILPGDLNFHFLDLSFDFRTILCWLLWSITPSENFPIITGLVYPLK